MKYFIKSSSVSLLFIALMFFLSSLSNAISEESSSETIYKGKDSRGRLVFSNKPSELVREEVKLPKIQKENIDSKISRLKLKTPKNCIEHAGVDCNAGPDNDGSVICQDGYKEAVLRFQDKCTEAILRVENAEIKKIGTIKELTVVLRNHSPVKAKKVRTEIALPGEKLKLSTGPRSIDPWGIAEYQISSYKKTKLISDKVRYKVRCKNCQHTLKK